MRKPTDSEVIYTIENFLPYDNMFKVNTDLINDIINKELNPINKKKFYISRVLRNIDEYNKLYLKEFDEKLDLITSSTDNFNIRDFSLVLKHSSRLCSDIYKNLLINLSEL